MSMRLRSCWKLLIPVGSLKQPLRKRHYSMRSCSKKFAVDLRLKMSYYSLFAENRHKFDVKNIGQQRLKLSRNLKYVSQRYNASQKQESTILHTRILQVVMLWAKFGRIKIRTNLLQRFNNNFGHFDKKFCYEIGKTNFTFQTKLPIATRSDWLLCHRKIVNIS